MHKLIGKVYDVVVPFRLRVDVGVQVIFKKKFYFTCQHAFYRCYIIVISIRQPMKYLAAD